MWTEVISTYACGCCSSASLCSRPHMHTCMCMHMHQPAYLLVGERLQPALPQVVLLDGGGEGETVAVSHGEQGVLTIQV